MTNFEGIPKSRQEQGSEILRTTIQLQVSGPTVSTALIPPMSHPVLEGKPNANHVRARISNSRTQQLHNMDIITQCSNSIKKGEIVVDYIICLRHPHILYNKSKCEKRNVDKCGLHRQPTGGLPLTHTQNSSQSWNSWKSPSTASSSPEKWLQG